MPNRYALIIGNSEYVDSKLAKLRTPDSDVNALAGVLQKDSLGNFDEVEVLLNRDSATVRKTITQFFSNKKRDDLLLLYFSGHGVLDDRGRLFLAVRDTEHHLLRGTSLPASFITDEMDNCNSKRQILILDCCHSGAFARGSKGMIGKSVGTSSAFMGNGYGRVVLTATDSTEYAWEGESLLGAKQNSVFTRYLIQGIETGQADLNHDGFISIDELYEFAHDNVSESTGKQTPGKWSFKQQGELIISKNPFLDQDVPENQTPAPLAPVKETESVGPSLSAQLLTSGLAGGIIATLLLLYPLYIYIPSPYVSGWYKGYGILAYPLMLLSLIPIAWSGWLMARRAKTGWEATFLGAQAGTIASSLAFLFLIATATGVSAFRPALELMPGTLLSSEQLSIVLVSPLIDVIRRAIFAWLIAELAGFILGSVGCLFHMQRSGEKISFSGFDLTFDLYWWKMILGGVISAILILTLSNAAYKPFSDEILETARRANYQMPTLDKVLVNGFPSLLPLVSLLFILILGCLSTLGKVPEEPSQQRTIALYAIIAALVPWVNPLLWFYRYLIYGVSSIFHMLIALLCAIAGVILIWFSVKLIGKSGWGKLTDVTGKHFWGTQFANAFVFLLLAAPALFLGGFYIFVFMDSIGILRGTSNNTVQELIQNAYGLQVKINLIAVLSIWIVYVILGALLKPILWAHNGIAGLIPINVPQNKPGLPPPLDGTVESAPLPNDKNRYYKAAGFILGIPLLFVIAFQLFSKPAPRPVTPLQTPGLLLTLQAYTQPATPTHAVSTAGYAATKTIAAAFTQIAVSTQAIINTNTPIPTVTKTPTATPITTLTPTGVVLLLDKNYSCRKGPGMDFEEVTSLASGVRVPILATNAKTNGWWLVMIKLSVSTNAVCWIENGTVEGDLRDIPVIDVP